MSRLDPPQNSVEVFQYNFFEPNKCYEKCNRVSNIVTIEGANYCPKNNLTYVGMFTHYSQGNSSEANFSAGPINLNAPNNAYFRECRTGGSRRKRRKRTRRR
jgi:hypothetical protein